MNRDLSNFVDLNSDYEMISELKKLVRELPEINKFTLKTLVGFLRDISPEESVPRFATLFSPVLFVEENLSVDSMLEDIKAANRVMCKLIQEFPLIFSVQTVIDAAVDNNFLKLQSLLSSVQFTRLAREHSKPQTL
jgi:hypothetical protein